MKDQNGFKPFIPANQVVPEMTAVSIVLGIILAVLFGAANAYLGLRVGMTVSASIPAAVISMGVIRVILKRDSILENNMVQTIGSAGESVAAGAIFTLPALFMWMSDWGVGAPSLVEISLIALCGGVLGVLFMIPLRQALIVKEHGVLPYPEGTACAEVLVAGEQGGSKAGVVFAGMGIAAAYKFIADGLKLFPKMCIRDRPHAVMYGDYFHVSPGKGASGDFRQFGVRDVSMEVSYDREFVERLCDLADGEDFPLGTLGDTGGGLDHGTLVPLYFIRKYRKDVRLVRLGLSGLSLSDHYRAGQLVARAAGQLGRRVAFVASGDLSHKLTEDGPYGFAPQGPEYDRRIMEVMGQARFGELFGFGESFCEKAAECGHRSFVMMAGAFDRRAVEARALSYEGPFGVGYGVCVFRDAGPDDSRKFLEQYEDGQREACARIDVYKRQVMHSMTLSQMEPEFTSSRNHREM